MRRLHTQIDGFTVALAEAKEAAPLPDDGNVPPPAPSSMKQHLLPTLLI
jgi:hypothetical protein